MTRGSVTTARGTGLKLHIDWTACDGRGLCLELAPELLDRDEWGFPLARSGRGAAVAGEHLDAAREAVAACPKRALKLLRR
jgi:ferredoxin